MPETVLSRFWRFLAIFRCYHRQFRRPVPSLWNTSTILISLSHCSLPRSSAADCWLSDSPTPLPACWIQDFSEYHRDVLQPRHWSPHSIHGWSFTKEQSPFYLCQSPVEFMLLQLGCARSRVYLALLSQFSLCSRWPMGPASYPPTLLLTCTTWTWTRSVTSPARTPRRTRAARALDTA